MSATSYYAVAKGRMPGVYTSWPQAKAQVDGFKFPKYRKFATREEASEFVQRHGSAVRADEPQSAATSIEHDADALVVFTDGSAIGNGSRNARAGYAMVWPNHPTLTSGKPLQGDGKTNNRAEFMACIDALQIVDSVDATRMKPLHIYTDSMLLINTTTKWMKGWKKNGWRKASGDPILNRDLVERLDVLLASTPRKVIWQHIEAHTNKQDWLSTWNAKADELAKKSAA
jgi:ribonuclease HI